MSDEITTPQEDMPQDRSAESEVSAESHSAYKVPVSDKAYSPCDEIAR